MLQQWKRRWRINARRRLTARPLTDGGRREGRRGRSQEKGKGVIPFPKFNEIFIYTQLIVSGRGQTK